MYTAAERNALEDMRSHHQGKTCQIEIKLDEPYIVLRGDESEAADFKVSGSVIIHATEQLDVKSIRVELEGKRQSRHVLKDDERTKFDIPVIVNRVKFLEKEQPLLSGAHKKYPPGDHTLPFEFSMPGDTCESIEGLSDNFVIYNIKAVVERNKLFAKDLATVKRLRIIRTLGSDPVEFVDPREVTGIWPEKVKYSFSTKSRAAIFGDKIPTDIQLTPIPEKLRVGTIDVTLWEERKIRTSPAPSEQHGDGKGMWKESELICATKRDLRDIIPTDVDPELSLPMHKIEVPLELPQSLAKCRQSVEKHGHLQIRHTLYFSVILHNEDGHSSQVKAHFSIRIFISPELPLNEFGEVTWPSNAIGRPSANGGLLEEMQTAPPQYGPHQLDRLYDDVHNVGFATPGTMSGAASPLVRSRRPSSEHLVSYTNGMGGISQQALAHRLTALQEGVATVNIGSAEAHGSPERQNSDISTGHSSSHGHSPATDSTAEPAAGYFAHVPPPSIYNHAVASAVATPIPQHVDYNMDALSRQPSYDTAVRTPLVTPPNGAPPRYSEDAVNAPMGSVGSFRSPLRQGSTC